VTDAVKTWDHLKQTEIADLNKALHRAKLPELNLKQSPTDMPDEGDEP